jgi:hypothetical protein
VKIAQERIKLDVMRGDAIPRAHLEMGLALLAGVLRRAIELLQRNWGNDAAEVMTEALAKPRADGRRCSVTSIARAANDESQQRLAGVPVLRRMAAQIRIPRLRTMRQFAEEEIVLPTGPHQGRKSG